MGRLPWREKDADEKLAPEMSASLCQEKDRRDSAHGKATPQIPCRDAHSLGAAPLVYCRMSEKLMEGSPGRTTRLTSRRAAEMRSLLT